MSRGKLVNLNISKKYRTKFGTIDRNNPKSIYFNIISWVLPKYDSDFNYERIICNLRKLIKQKIFDNIDENFFLKERTIVDLDIRSSGINANKKSFMNCEVFIFQKNEIPFTSRKISSKTRKIVSLLIKDVFEQNDHFTHTKTKR